MSRIGLALCLSGTYGDVFRVQHYHTGKIYALKQIRDEYEANGIPATAMREASILKQLNHPNIIQLHDVFLTDERCYFLLEYMDEDLKRYLDHHRPVDRSIVQVNESLLASEVDDVLHLELHVSITRCHVLLSSASHHPSRH